MHVLFVIIPLFTGGCLFAGTVCYYSTNYWWMSICKHCYYFTIYWWMSICRHWLILFYYLLVDIYLQILFVIVLLFTSTRTEPILVPVFATYAGLIARLILDVGFWYVLARHELPDISEVSHIDYLLDVRYYARCLG